MIQHLHQCTDLNETTILCIALNLNEHRNILPVLNYYIKLFDGNIVYVLEKKLFSRINKIEYKDRVLIEHMNLDRIKLYFVETIFDFSTISNLRSIFLASSSLPSKLCQMNVAFKSITTIAISHGLLSRHKNCPGQEWLLEKLNTSFHVFCESNYSYQVYKEFGWDMANIKIVGMPVFQIAKEMSIEASKNPLVYPVPQNKEILNILYLVQDYPPANQIRNLQMLKNLVSKHDKWRLTIRLHPVMSFTLGVLKAWIKENTHQISISDPCLQDSLEAIQAHDVIVSHWSTGLLEAAIMKKIYIPLMSDIEENFLDFPTICTTTKDVELLIENSLCASPLFSNANSLNHWFGNLENSIQILANKIQNLS